MAVPVRRHNDRGVVSCRVSHRFLGPVDTGNYDTHINLRLSNRFSDSECAEPHGFSTQLKLDEWIRAVESARNHRGGSRRPCPGIHGLKYQQQSIAVGRVEQSLRCAELLGAFAEELLVLPIGLVEWLAICRPFVEVDFLSRSYAKLLDVNFRDDFS